MTKILYIPNGAYIKYHSCKKPQETSEELEDFGITCEEDIQKELRFLLGLGSKEVSNWLSWNNITWPILPNELEVIYD